LLANAIAAAIQLFENGELRLVSPPVTG
jgi:hypothetical protein